MFSGHILYKVAIPFAISMILGGYIGAKFAIKKGSTVIKPIFLVMAFITWMINGRYIEFLLNFDKEHYQLEKTYIEKLKHLNNDEVILYTGHPFFLSVRNTNIILIDRFKYNDTKKLNNEIYNAFNYNKIYFNYSEVNDSQEMIDKVISIIEANNYKMILNFKYKHNNELPYYVFEKIKQKD